MIKIGIGIITITLFLFTTLQSAEAGREDRRQARQRARIGEGVKSGELTRGEAARARGDQRQIRRMEKRLEADGELSDQDKAKLERRQDRASRRLHRMKHNDRERGNGESDSGGAAGE